MTGTYEQRPDSPGRRKFLGRTLGIAAGLVGGTLALGGEAQAESGLGWRFCQQCFVMFCGQGTNGQGRCVVGGSGHVAQGFQFSNMPTGYTETPNDQSYWNFCGNCYNMYFSYYGPGLCAGGNGHRSLGATMLLRHDVPETPTAQAHWRFCYRCFCMFYGGYPTKGRCATGGIHQAQGFDFVLPHA
ncbi:hypothetical protein [Streptomyces sp. CBMA29]|uniref:hypothetical protein n=1 Tax=Streptomyces sp. CBMA29 TaxID=1896314 RepID=UPI001661E6E8|nr:hypothetical protein [Streptomyces sp. CBMA29]MBD0735334.1 hypothetical protein [Streptomyces sp. CBMA29]